MFLIFFETLQKIKNKISKKFFRKIYRHSLNFIGEAMSGGEVIFGGGVIFGAEWLIAVLLSRYREIY